MFGGGVEALRQKIAGEKVNWKRIAASAAGGAASGALAGVTMGGSLVAQGALAAGSSAVEGTVTRTALGESTSGKDVLMDAGIGLATAGLVRGGAAAFKSVAKKIKGKPSVSGDDLVSSNVKNSPPADIEIDPKVRGRANEEVALDGMGFEKNTAKIASTTEDVKAIPDALTDSVLAEVKDTKVVSRTKQIRTYEGFTSDAIEGESTDLTRILITRKDTHITKPIYENESFGIIIKVSDFSLLNSAKNY